MSYLQTELSGRNKLCQPKKFRARFTKYKKNKGGQQHECKENFDVSW